ncbi:olfactory receptor 4C13-like [Manis pentadactyla]|uniref:olfactory receptor 4C13-like n=1 Tax=Manis pentadactyla TaxID=143292 RepID=UPI00255CED8E|nr:olfactory receptor 4C13-like [Manis pentadactyla]
MQRIIFVVFFLIYIFPVVGDVLILVTVTASPLLGTPRCFFLAYLSFIDACCSSVSAPKLIVDLLHEKKTVLFNGCMTQIFGEHFFGGADVTLLTVMAYDRYVAICKPLNYTMVMNQQVCGLLVGVMWVGAFLHATIQILFISQFSFCGPNIIDHFMSDLIPLLNLACTDTRTLGIFVAARYIIYRYILAYLVSTFVVPHCTEEGTQRCSEELVRRTHLPPQATLSASVTPCQAMMTAT